MNDADARQLIQRYATSHFHAHSTQGWFEEGNPHARVVRGSSVSVLRGRVLVGAMLENVEASRKDIAATAFRMRRAKQDGLLDRDCMQGLPKELQKAWVAAVDVLRGDYQRACAELRHWQEYAETASRDELPTLSDEAARGENLVRGLAGAKTVLYSGKTDITDDEKNAAVNNMREKLEHWSQKNREPGEEG